MTSLKIRTLTETAVLGVLLFVSGLFRLPSPLPGSEFQLSAPLAAAICGVFGFRIYLAAGILASALTLLTGGGTVFHILIAMVYRLTVGAAFGILGPSAWFFFLAGPAGTLAARAGHDLHRYCLPPHGPSPAAGQTASPGGKHAGNLRENRRT